MSTGCNCVELFSMLDKSYSSFTINMVKDTLFVLINELQNDILPLFPEYCILEDGKFSFHSLIPQTWTVKMPSLPLSFIAGSAIIHRA